MRLGNILRIGFIALAVVYGLYFGITVYKSFSPNSPTPTSSRQFTHNSLGLQEVWRSRNVWLPITGPKFTVADSTVVIANHDPNASLHYRLQALNTKLGRQLWEIDLPQRVGVHSLLIEERRLYVGIDWEIQAYDLANGQLLWQTPGEPIQRTRYELVWSNGTLINYSTVLQEDYSLMSVYNPSTGTLLQQEKVSAFPLLTTAKVEYRGSCDQLSAINIPSKKVKWQTRLSGCPQHKPVLIDSSLLVATYSDYRSIAGLHLISTVDGRVIWYALEDDLVSNFAIIDRTVYTIRRNGDIVGLDLDSGQEIGVIQFNTDQTDPSQNAYWLAANERQLFAYYGDSRELIAFGD